MTIKPNKANIITFAVLVILAWLIIIFLSGCFYGHATYKNGDIEATVTVATLGKSVAIDPNGYTSDTDKIRFAYPPIFMETKDD